MQTSKLQAGSLRRRLLRPWAPILVAFLFADGLAGPAEAEGHGTYHASDYQHWKQPGTNASCCNDHDCGPVRAEVRRGQWFALREGEWIAIPPDRIIREINPNPEQGHLCYTYGRVLCFVPPHTGE